MKKSAVISKRQSNRQVMPKAKRRCWIISVVDITRRAEMGTLDPIVGREEEIERVSQILSRRKKNNPILTVNLGG
jgi:ATP-dependent Clp protease ATP-binding subunit ClpA